MKFRIINWLMFLSPQDFSALLISLPFFVCRHDYSVQSHHAIPKFCWPLVGGLKKPPQPSQVIIASTVQALAPYLLIQAVQGCKKSYAVI